MSETTDLEARISTLKSGLLLSGSANVVMIFLVGSLFADTEGYCDDSAVAARGVFRFIFLIQLLINIPTAVLFHQVDKAAASIDTRFGEIGSSFGFFCAAFLLKLYVTLATLLDGPFSDRVFAMFVCYFLILSFISFALLKRFENENLVELF